MRAVRARARARPQRARAPLPAAAHGRSPRVGVPSRASRSWSPRHEPRSASMTSMTDGVWRLDPDRSSVEFHVPNFWGLMTVKGRFGGFDGTLDLSAEPAIELNIDAD